MSFWKPTPENLEALNTITGRGWSLTINGDGRACLESGQYLLSEGALSWWWCKERSHEASAHLNGGAFKHPAAAYSDLVRKLRARRDELDLLLAEGAADSRCDAANQAAMELYDAAKKVHPEDRPNFFSDAFSLAADAAALATSQPTHAILYRSAATIALDAQKGREAIRLAAMGLARPDVPEKLLGELVEVLARAIGVAACPQS